MGTPWVSFNGKDCSGCKHLNERGYCEFTGCVIPCTVRATIPEVKPPSNADRIRSMTDEELAEFIVRCVEADFFRVNVLGTHSNSAGEWLGWLRQEAQT